MSESCRHCGTEIPAHSGAEEGFCCHGCSYVYHLIHDEGFDRYYELRDSAISPVRQGTLDRRDYRWLEQAVNEAAEASPKIAEMDLDLEGVSCLGCVWLIEKIFKRYPGSHRIEINPQLGQIRVAWRPGLFPWLEFARELQRFGYLLSPAGQRSTSNTTHGLTIRMGLCAAFALNAMLFTLPRYLGMEPDFELARLFHWLTLLFASLSMAVGGSYFIQRSIAGLRSGLLHIDFPIALGVSLAYVGSLYGWIREWESFIYFDFVSVFTFLMLVGRWVQERALEFNRHRLIARSRRPQNVDRLLNEKGEVETLPLAKIQPGMQLRVASGDLIPVGSRLLSPAASCSLEWINGESDSQTFKSNQVIPGGAINIGQEAVIVESRETWTGSLLEKLLQESRADPRSPLFEKVLKVYLWIVLFVATGGGLFWAYGPPTDGTQALQVVLSVLVVSCPCALGVAAPLAHEWAVLRLRQFGLFVREASVFARLDNVRKLVFDKTGTLTLEAPQLTNPEALDRLDSEAREALRRLTAESAHPYSRALRQMLWRVPEDRNSASRHTWTVSEVIGQGMQSTDGTWKLGRPQSGSAGDCALIHDGRELAHFYFAEALRSHAREAFSALSQKYPLYILSGDRPEKVQHLAERIGLDPGKALGGQDPESKAEWIRTHQPESILYVGDGANDSLAFDLAGVSGAPVVERGILDSKADFFFSGSGLNGILALFRVARVRACAARRVFGFSVSYNIVVATIALMGWMNPLLAAILMPLSSVATIALVAMTYKQAR